MVGTGNNFNRIKGATLLFRDNDDDCGEILDGWWNTMLMPMKMAGGDHSDYSCGCKLQSFQPLWIRVRVLKLELRCDFKTLRRKYESCMTKAIQLENLQGNSQTKQLKSGYNKIANKAQSRRGCFRRSKSRQPKFKTAALIDSIAVSLFTNIRE